MPFVILNAISTRVATWKSALTALYSHRPQPCLFQSPLLWNWDAFRMRWPINERHELTFLPVIRALGVIASLLQRVSNYHRTSNTNQSASYLSSFLAKPPKRRGKKGQRHGCFCRLIPSTPFGKFTFSLSTVKPRTREQTRIYSRKKKLSLLFSAYTCQWCGKRSAVDLG